MRTGPVVAVDQQATTPHLCGFDEAPPFLKDNPNVTHGFRKNYGWADCCWSLFASHNQTGNVWSVLVCVILSSLYLKGALEEACTPLHSSLLTTFSWSACLTCILSAQFHLFNCISERVFVITQKIDHFGIFAGVPGRNIALSYFAFYESPLFFWITAVVTISFLLVQNIGPLFRPIHERSFRKSNKAGRVAALMVPAAFYTAPFLFVFYRSVQQTNFSSEFWCAAVFPLVLATGTALYATKWPEIRFPGLSNVWFYSHPLMHYCMAVSHLLEFHVLLCLLRGVQATHGLCLPA